MVGLEVKSLGGDFNQFVSQLTNVGMQIQNSSDYYGLVERLCPDQRAADHRQAASDAERSWPITIRSLAPSIKARRTTRPRPRCSPTSRVPRTTSTAPASRWACSRPASITSRQWVTDWRPRTQPATWIPNNPVNVIQDDPAQTDDEGRAMLENIHDIAPGANLQFATAFISELGFAQNITALAKAGSQILVDDVHYFDEPFFQDG